MRRGTASINIEGSFQHLLTDLYAFVATAVAAVVVITAGEPRADSVASLLVAALMVRSGVALVERRRVLLEAAPPGVDPDAIGATSPPSRAWCRCTTSTSGGDDRFPGPLAHVVVGADTDCHAVRDRLERRIRERFAITHTTLQVDHDREGELLEITPPGD